MKSSTYLGILGILGAAGMIAVVVFAPKQPGRSPGTDLRLIGFATMALGWGMFKFVKAKNEESAPAREQAPILAMADVEAVNFGHNYIGTEHLLCALVKMPDSELERLFGLCRVRLEPVRAAVVGIVKTGPNPPANIRRPQTPRLKRVLVLAETERARLAHLTRPESLMLAILLEGQGVAIRALKSMQVNLEQLREELQKSSHPTEPLSPHPDGSS